MNKNARFFVIALLALSLLRSPVHASWLIAAEPATNNPEAVWSAPAQEETSSEIRYAYLDGESWSASVSLSSSGAVDTSPCMVFDGAGGRSIIWQSVEDWIVLVSRPAASSSWTEAVVLSDKSDVSQHPSAVFFERDTYVGYETDPGAGRTVTVSKMDPGSNVERTLVATTESSAPLDVRLHEQDGHLWIDWIDSESAVGYAVMEGGSWSAPQTQACDGPEESDMNHARDLVRQWVLNP
jgi:hypothetical protein